AEYAGTRGARRSRYGPGARPGSSANPSPSNTTGRATPVASTRVAVAPPGNVAPSAGTRLIHATSGVDAALSGAPPRSARAAIARTDPSGSSAAAVLRAASA